MRVRCAPALALAHTRTAALGAEQVVCRASKKERATKRVWAHNCDCWLTSGRVATSIEPEVRARAGLRRSRSSPAYKQPLFATYRLDKMFARGQTGRLPAGCPCSPPSARRANDQASCV